MDERADASVAVAAAYALAVLAVLLVAGALGLDNLAASIAIGISGAERSLRLRIALTFGLFEAGMPLIGLLAGRGLAQPLGGSAHIIGGLLLVATGGHAVWEGVAGEEDRPAARGVAGAPVTRLILLAAALSIDNLVVGFALGTDHVALLLSIVTIAAASIGLSLVGLEIGARLGARVEHRGELIGGLVLIGVGVAVLADLI